VHLSGRWDSLVVSCELVEERTTARAFLLLSTTIAEGTKRCALGWSRHVNQDKASERLLTPFAAQVRPKSGNYFVVHCRIPRATDCRSAASATDSDARIPARVMSAFQPATFHSLKRVDVPMKPRKPLDRRTARADFDSVPGLDHPEPPIKSEPSAVPDILLGEF
jgi:hypothetical protein